MPKNKGIPEDEWGYLYDGSKVEYRFPLSVVIHVPDNHPYPLPTDAIESSVESIVRKVDERILSFKPKILLYNLPGYNEMNLYHATQCDVMSGYYEQRIYSPSIRDRINKRAQVVRDLIPHYDVIIMQGFQLPISVFEYAQEHKTLLIVHDSMSWYDRKQMWFYRSPDMAIEYKFSGHTPTTIFAQLEINSHGVLATSSLIPVGRPMQPVCLTDATVLWL